MQVVVERKNEAVTEWKVALLASREESAHFQASLTTSTDQVDRLSKELEEVQVLCLRISPPPPTSYGSR